MPEFDIEIEYADITPVSDGHGGFRTKTVSRIRWVALEEGLDHEHVQHFGVSMMLPCWCALNNEPLYNPPVGTNLPAMYFPLTQNITGTCVLRLAAKKNTNGNERKEKERKKE